MRFRRRVLGIIRPRCCEERARRAAPLSQPEHVLPRPKPKAGLTGRQPIARRARRSNALLCGACIFSENRCPLFGIMRKSNGRALSLAALIRDPRTSPLSRPDPSARRPLRRAPIFCTLPCTSQASAGALPCYSGDWHIARSRCGDAGYLILFGALIAACRWQSRRRRKAASTASGGDYTNFQVRNGDPAVCAGPLRTRRALPRLELFLSAN